jgi:RNA polymerase sigma-70 factor (ECF subfamily)
MLGDREDAQDIVQETFLSVFRSIKALREPASFATWIYTIALNHCRARRKFRSADLLLQDLAPDGAEGVLEPPTPMPAARNGSESIEALDVVRKALANLNDDHRTAIVLKEYLGLSLEELARVMNCPLSTAKSRLYHGLQGVQRNLKRMGFKLRES